MVPILPRDISELPVISGNRNTFGGCVFNKSYYDLTFEQRVKIAVDLVRQSMLFTNFPNPDSDYITLIGDSYTSCIVLENYLKSNGIGKEYDLCLVEQSIYETISLPSRHFILLVKDDNNSIYQADPSPTTGYKCGKVEKIENNWYKRYTIISSYLSEKLNLLRNIAYEMYTGCSKDKLDDCLRMVKEIVKSNKIFLGYYLLICNCYYEKYRNVMLSGISNDEKLFIDDIANAMSLIYDSYLSLITVNNGGLKVRYSSDDICKINEIIKKLTKKLEYLKKQENLNLELILDLMQTIYRLKVNANIEREESVCINGKYYYVSNLTPRFFYENKLNVVMIKSSSFYINKEIDFTNIMTGNKEISGGYFVNLGSKDRYGFPLMELFHPDGVRYVEEMNGPNYIFLINESASNLKKRKLSIRNQYASIYDNEVVKWFSGNKIRWTSLGMNMVHSADNSSETCCNFQCGFPNSQLMTRFMYPNLKLIF